MAAQRPARGEKPAIRLTPNKGPIFHPPPSTEEPSTPLPPPDHAPPGPSPSRNDHYSPAARVPEGDTSDSDDDQSKPIPDFEKSNSWFEESKWAAKDPTRVLTASELPPTFKWNIVDTVTKQESRVLKDFKDAMYKALDKVYKLQNGSRLRIKVPHDIVDNISYSFAKAQMLNPDLANRTESFFVDWPNQLFTVAVPTDFPTKKPWTSQGKSTSFITKPIGRMSPRSFPNNSFVRLIGPGTVKEYLNNSLLMDLLEWRVKSTLSMLP